MAYLEQEGIGQNLAGFQEESYGSKLAEVQSAGGMLDREPDGIFRPRATGCQEELPSPDRLLLRFLVSK